MDSIRGYAAVVYMRTEYEDGQGRVCLVSSKTRVVPLKTQTILRLELLGATFWLGLCLTFAKLLILIIPINVELTH